MENGDVDDTFCSTEIRLGFVRKVFGILSMQLLFTTAIVWWASHNQGFRDFIGFE